MDNGFVTLHRKFLKWEWYDDINTKSLFIHLLLKVNYSKNKWRGIEVDRGNCITSRKKLALELGLSEQQIRTCLKKLQSTNEITITTSRDYSLIAINKYDDYQNKSNKITNQSTNEQPAESDKIEKPINQQSIRQQRDGSDNSNQPNNQPNNQQATTNNNDNNIKSNTPYDKIFNYFVSNTTIGARGLSEKRKTLIKSIHNSYNLETIYEMIDIVGKSNYLQKKENKWAKFDWCFNPNNFLKIIEGNYNNNTETIEIDNVVKDQEYYRLEQEREFSNGRY